MPRRQVKTSRIDDLGEITPEITAVVSTKAAIEESGDPQTYFKRNYVDALKQIIPNIYFSDDADASGLHIPFADQLINSHILANENQSTILPVSSVASSIDSSNIGTPAGFGKHFYKATPPATLNPDDFERNILLPLGKSFSNFQTSSSFTEYVSGTLLPLIPCISGAGMVGGAGADVDLAYNTASAFSITSPGTHDYLINNLGWAYFLNRGAMDNDFSYDPSVLLTDTMSNLWFGRSLVLEDYMKVYQEYLWRNQWEWDISGLVPPLYVSAASMEGTYVSGTQLLDALKTLNEVVYSPHYLDSPDHKVENAFTDYFDTDVFLSGTREGGPFTRFLEAVGFSLADRATESTEINTLYDIGRCPSEFLDLVAELIGWQLIGADVDKWRVQLRNAVDIYKQKGTKRSIEVLMSLLFGYQVINNETDVKELWESYIPDLMYYSLATSSTAFGNGFETYTPELAEQLGIASYSDTDMALNISYAVDTILFNLVREYPDSFYLGDDPFPPVRFVLASNPSEEWLGPYHIEYVDVNNELTIRYYTGEVTEDNQEELLLQSDPNFTFFYRGRDFPIPPYEKRQYYTVTRVTQNMVEKIEFYLRCFGVNDAFAKKVRQYIEEYTTQTLDTDRVINTFLMFGTSSTIPPNSPDIITTATSEKYPSPINMLPLWNGKSSHYLLSFDASNFDFTSYDRSWTGSYGIQRIMKALDTVSPAHAIPEILVSVDTLDDSASALGDNDCRQIRPNFTDVYTGSSQAFSNYGACSVDMDYVCNQVGIVENRFKRYQANNINDPLLSGTGQTYIVADDYEVLPRNTLRRRGYKNLLPETKFFTRTGRNNPGSLEPSNSYFATSEVYVPLGYIPSAMKFQEVALVQNPYEYGVGKLLDSVQHGVWEICQNLNSTSAVFDYQVSNTFASRAKLDLQSSDCQPYGRRGQLDEIIYVMNKTHDYEKFLQASSIVSGYYDDNGNRNYDWAASTSLVTPNDLSAWYSTRVGVEGHLDVIKSIGNELINSESADESLSYYESFRFGQKVFKAYDMYNRVFDGGALSENYANLSGGPNFLSHTYGPLVYNSQFETAGSSLELSSYLDASSPELETNIAYYGGSGVLSLSGMNDVGSLYELGTSATSATTDAYYRYPEFYNKFLVSSIELVDTSTPYAFTAHPIFSLMRLSRSAESQYDLAKYLTNNRVIRYHRSQDPDSLPRLRVNINPAAVDGPDLDLSHSRNYLEPDSRFSVRVKAHNTDLSASIIGGQRLGFTIRTQVEDEKVWIFNPIGREGECGKPFNNWKQVSVADLQSDGINIIKQYAQTYEFPLREAEVVIIPPPEVGQNTFTNGENCVDPLSDDLIIDGGAPQAYVNLGYNTLDTIPFIFTTYNDQGSRVTQDYIIATGKNQLHRRDQVYVLEFFVMDGDSKKFVVFEEIFLKNETLFDKAVIETEYGDSSLDKKDLKACFLFFKNLTDSINSRNALEATGMSGHNQYPLEASGGSKINYRSNIQMYDNTITAANSTLTYLDIDEDPKL